MIVSSEKHFPKDYQTGYEYCLMVNHDDKVTMVWNYNAREWMDIYNKNGEILSGKYTVDEIKKMYKNNLIHFEYIFEEIKKGNNDDYGF